MNFIHKTLCLLALTLAPFQLAHAGIVGGYDAEVRQGISASSKVSVSQDPQAKSKIWIDGIVSGAKIYATLQAQDEEGVVYSIPSQTAGGQKISAGSVVYSTGDDEIVITNDPSANPSQITVGPKGVDIADAQGKSVLKADSSGNVAVNSSGARVQAGKDGQVTIKTDSGATKFFTFIGKKGAGKN